MTATVLAGGHSGTLEDAMAAGPFELHPHATPHSDDCPVRWSWGPCPGCNDWTVYTCEHIPLEAVDQAVTDHAEHECPALAIIAARWLLDHPPRALT